MSFFKKIRNFFNKPYAMPSKMENCLIYMFDGSGKIELGKQLIVPDGYIAVFVKREKVYDYFTSGEYVLNLKVLPLLEKKFKLSRPNKNGKVRKKFKADIFFVSLKSFNKLQFANYGEACLNDKNFTKTRVKYDVEISFRLVDPPEFLQNLLKLFAIIKKDVAIEQLKIWVSEKINRFIEKNNFKVEQFFNNDNCFIGLKDYLNRNFLDIGVEFEEVNIIETKLPKTLFKVIETGNNADFNEKVQQKSVVNNNGTIVYNNSLFDENVDMCETENLNNNSHVENITDEGEILTKTIAFKTCKNCGSKVPTTAKTCFNCKKPFKKTCANCGNELNETDFVCSKCKCVVI